MASNVPAGLACLLADRCSSRARDRRRAYRGFRDGQLRRQPEHGLGRRLLLAGWRCAGVPRGGRLQLAAARSRPTSAGRSSAAGAHATGPPSPARSASWCLSSRRRRRSGPTVFVAPGSLGAASGWVRGTWPIAFSADGPTGACQLAASLAGASVSQPLNEPQSQVTWHQCPAGSFSQSFNTAAVASGAGVPLVMWARDAAYDYGAGQYLSGTATSYVNIDNDSGECQRLRANDAPSTAGTQYVTATGDCWSFRCLGHRLFGRRRSVSVVSAAKRADTGGRDWSPPGHVVTALTTPETLPGHVATSAPQTWTLSIRQPTVSGIGFGKLVDSLLCKRVTERVRVPAHWVTVRRHHKRVRVKRRARTQAGASHALPSADRAAADHRVDDCQASWQDGSE